MTLNVLTARTQAERTAAIAGEAVGGGQRVFRHGYSQPLRPCAGSGGNRVPAGHGWSILVLLRMQETPFNLFIYAF